MIGVDKEKEPWYKFNPGWIALSISIVAIIFALGVGTAKVDQTTINANETRRIVDFNSNRITALEQFNKNLCEDIADIKSELKAIRKDQVDFYKAFNKHNGVK